MMNAIQIERYQPVERVGQVAGAIGKNPDILGRTIKVIIPALETLAMLSQHFCHHELAWCKPLLGRFSIAKDILNASCFIDRIKEWASEGSPWADEKWISRICLTVAHCIEPVHLLDKAIFHWTAKKVYEIAVLAFVKNIFYLIGSFYGFCHGLEEFKETRREISATHRVRERWMNEDINAIAVAESNACFEELNSILQKHQVQPLQQGDGNRIRQISLGNALPPRLKDIEKIKQLANYILALQSRTPGVQQSLREYKIALYDTKLENLNKKWWKAALGLGGELGKFFGILFFIGLKKYTPIYPQLKDPKIDLALAIFSLAGYSCSLGKSLCGDDVIKPIKISPFVCP